MPHDTPPVDTEALVVGGGFFGARLAALLARRGMQVTLCERADALLTRASYRNQARVHGGYHYPRSLLTARRSRANFPRFLADHASAVDQSFTQLYAIARRQSKVTAAQFAEFCRRVGAPLERADLATRRQFDAAYVDAVFVVEECAFDAGALARLAAAALTHAGVPVRTGVRVTAVAPGGARRLRVTWECGGTRGSTDADTVVLCTYSALNEVIEQSGLPPVPLVHELTELALVDPPEWMRGRGVTVMDGPFWSCMPFPAESTHSLSHVRYTPHARWSDGAAPRHDAEALLRQPPSSQAPHMLRDAARYLPEMAEARYRRSLWEVKTILPRSDVDDSRPILVHAVPEAPGLLAVLGAKIDNVYDVEEALTQMLDGGFWR